jgi:predicted nucleic acid-binding protein
LIFVDTNVAIELRDDAANAGPRLASITPQPVFSLITWIELEAGVERDAALALIRRQLLNELLAEIEVVMLTAADVASYGRIIAQSGYNRRRVLDRLIAAQALTRNASLVTANTADFADIAGLTLIEW